MPKGQEVSKAIFLETPLPSESPKICEGFLPLFLKWFTSVSGRSKKIRNFMNSHCCPHQIIETSAGQVDLGMENTKFRKLILANLKILMKICMYSKYCGEFNS